MIFGPPARIVNMKKYLSPRWDVALELGRQKFSREQHTLIWNNCHSHVAYCLNKMDDGTLEEWNGLWIFWITIRHGRLVDGCRCWWRSFGPSIIVYSFLLIISIVLII